jgi:hypothetical protein
MIMKKYILLLIVAAVGLSACDSDYLETAPEDQIGTTTILGTTEYAEMALNGICRAMSQQYLGTQGLNGEGTILNWYGTFTGNDAQKCNQTGWAALWNSTYHLRTNSIYLYYPWYYYYKLISNANGIICNIDEATGSDADKQFLKAQALVFRAYSFFRLSQLYSHRWKDEQGNCPGIVLRIDQSTGDQPLSTLAETYAQIYEDLDEAISLFQSCGKDRDEDEFYKPNLDVAYAVYAKAALTREDWANAKKYAALARANYPLMNTTQYSSGMSVPNNEWIWGVYDASDQTIYYYSFYAYMASNSNSGNNRSYPVAISKELIDQIPETDARRTLYLVPTDAEFKECNAAGRSTKTLFTRAQSQYGKWLYSTSWIFAYMQFKFRNIDNPGVGPFPILRAAEMYYTEAEADCHLGQEADAQQLLYTVVSPRDEAYTKSTKTGADLLAEVKLYRRFDLWGEGNDWFDYKRWGESIVRKSVSAGGSFHTTFAVTIKPEDGNAWTWAIPEKETDYNDAID